MNLQKNKPWRNKAYLEFVRSLPCCYTGQTENVQAHHLIGCGMGGTIGGKQSDIFTIPLTAEKHALFHSNPWALQIDQRLECLKVIGKAINAGVLKVSAFNEWVEGL